ncbi:MAG: hypothetical protein C0518_03345 [Opitutus sp.]|nr:hypothetical protein [Opitutus sp.]
MARGFSPQEEALYYRTAEAVLEKLAEAHEAPAILAVVREAFERFEQAYQSAPAAARAAVACRAGCGTCCHNDVAVQAHEVFIAAEFIQRTFSPEDLDAVIARAATHRAAYLAGRSDPAWKSPRTPCVLLREGSCSIYEGRPEICRAYHSNSLDGCIANLAAGYEKVDVNIRALRGRMFAVMLAIDQAVESAGFDDHAYDFGTALHEALTNSLCVVRWSRREPAFPESFRERED